MVMMFLRTFKRLNTPQTSAGGVFKDVFKREFHFCDDLLPEKRPGMRFLHHIIILKVKLRKLAHLYNV